MGAYDNIIRLSTIIFISIIILCLILTVINIIKDYKNSGNKLFAAFKKCKNSGEVKDVVLTILNSNLKEKPIIIDHDKTSFFALSEKEAMAVIIVEGMENLNGNLNDIYLSNNKGIKYDNPLKNIICDLKELEEKDIHLKLIVIRGNKFVNIKIKDLPLSSIMELNDFLMFISTLNRNDQKYYHKDLVYFEEEIGRVIGGHNQD